MFFLDEIKNLLIHTQFVRIENCDNMYVWDRVYIYKLWSGIGYTKSNTLVWDRVRAFDTPSSGDGAVGILWSTSAIHSLRCTAHAVRVAATNHRPVLH